MNSQGTNAEQPSFKIKFTNIHCKINITDQAQFAFVIRIGKISSRYTQKRQIHEGIIVFDDTLEVPIDQKLLAQPNTKKQKCEIMLYKYRLNREKQTKQLVGMASVAVAPQMLEEQSKKLRLTNSFDKEAFVECNIKIELGEADVISHNESKMSSFHMKYQQPSVNNELSQSRSKQQHSTPANKNHVKVGLITSNSRKSLHDGSDEKKQENSFLQLLIGSQNESNPSSQKQQIKSEQILSHNEDIASSNQALNTDKIQYNQKNQLSEVIRLLQQQNQTLANKVQGLQSQLLNQSIISNKSATSQNPQIPRPNTKRSPMIKKNTTITITPSFSKLQASGIILTQDVLASGNEQDIKQRTGKKSSIIRTQNKSNFTNEMQQSNCPYFSNQGSRVTQQLPKVPLDNMEASLQLTFAGERFQQKSHHLSVTPVIQVKFTPPAYPQGYEVRSNERSIVHSSISNAQRRNDRSYTKFNGKRKYQIVGAVRSPDESQINMSGLDHQLDQNQRREGGSIILSRPPLDTVKNGDQSFNVKSKKESSFDKLKTEGAQNEKPFLDFLKQKDENPFFKNVKDLVSNGMGTPKASMSQFPIPQGLFQESRRNEQDTEFEPQLKTSLTLQEIDLKTQEKFRRNERSLKMANLKIMQQNKSLKKERKSLQEQIEKKKQLSHEEFQNLKSQISTLRHKILQSQGLKNQIESKYQQLSKKYTGLEEENIKLKRDLKEQKAKYQYYFNMSNINDDKEKERGDYGIHETSFSSKKSTGKLQPESPSPIDTTKNGTRNERSITSISNFNKEDGSKHGVHNESKSLKKVDFSFDRNAQDAIKGDSLKKVVQPDISKPNIPKPTSSTAVSKLRMHVKPLNSPANGISGLLSQINSPLNGSFNGSYDPNNIGGMLGGLVGTGQTIKEAQKPSNFFSKQ